MSSTFWSAVRSLNSSPSTNSHSSSNSLSAHSFGVIAIGPFVVGDYVRLYFAVVFVLQFVFVSHVVAPVKSSNLREQPSHSARTIRSFVAIYNAICVPFVRETEIILSVANKGDTRAADEAERSVDSICQPADDSIRHRAVSVANKAVSLPPRVTFFVGRQT